jgi:hypothetical protein
MDAQQWLDTVFTPALNREALAYTNDADLLRGQLAALHECDVLDDQTHADALWRLDRAVEAARHRASFDVRPAGTTEPAPVPVAALRRVLAVAQPLCDVDGMSFMLISVELWTDHVNLLLAGLPTADTQERIRQNEAELNKWGRKHREGRSEGVLSPPLPRGNRLLELDIRLRDDLDTSYLTRGGSAGGSNTEWRLHRRTSRASQRTPGCSPSKSPTTPAAPSERWNSNREPTGATERKGEPANQNANVRRSRSLATFGGT